MSVNSAAVVATSFVREVIARLKGDADQVVAERNKRKAISSVKQQISGLENKQVDAETRLEEANEAFLNSIYQTEPISDSGTYSRGLASANSSVEAAEADLESIKKSIVFFTGVLETLEKE